LLVLSVMAVSLLFIGNPRLGSMNYRMMTQARYGAKPASTRLPTSCRALLHRTDERADRREFRHYGFTSDVRRIGRCPSTTLPLARRIFDRR